jgi:hypothetical protein
VIVEINAFSVTQRLVPNCSFVSSLCCGAAYERRFKRPLLTARLFPQDSKGQVGRSAFCFCRTSFAFV